MRHVIETYNHAQLYSLDKISEYRLQYLKISKTIVLTYHEQRSHVASPLLSLFDSGERYIVGLNIIMLPTAHFTIHCMSSTIIHILSDSVSCFWRQTLQNRTMSLQLLDKQSIKWLI